MNSKDKSFIQNAAECELNLKLVVYYFVSKDR